MVFGGVQAMCRLMSADLNEWIPEVIIPGKGCGCEAVDVTS